MLALHGLARAIQVGARQAAEAHEDLAEVLFGRFAGGVDDAALDEADVAAGGALGETEHARLAPHVQLAQDAGKNAFSEGSLHPDTRAGV